MPLIFTEVNIQKIKIMASSPITSWKIKGEKVEVVTNFIFLGSRITVDSDCSHEIKKCLLIGRKTMTTLDSKFKSLDITLPIQVPIVKARVFSRCHVWMWDQFSHSVVSNSLQPHGLQHARLPCPSPTPRTCSNSCPSSQWCHPAISCSVVPFSSCLQSFPASGSFPMSQFFTSGGQSIGAST